MAKYCNIDHLAEGLIEMGTFAKKLPPSWQGGRVCIPVCGPYGQYVGKMLPGTGLLLSMDAKELGITKPMPNVLSRTPVMKMVDFFKSERRGVAAAAMVTAALLVPNNIIRTVMAPAAMALSTYDSIINARANGKAQDIIVSRPVLSGTVANAWTSMWQQAGSYITAPSGSVHTNATSGAWSLGLTNPTGGDKCYILTFGMEQGLVANSSVLTDLLVGVGNLDFSLTTSQTVSSVPLTRYTSGVGVMMIFDVVATPAITTSALVVTYTNQSGVGSRSTVSSSIATVVAMQLVPSTNGIATLLQAGDYGVQSVQSLILNVNKGPGSFALNLHFPLVYIPGWSAVFYSDRDFMSQLTGVIELAQSAGAVLGCLNLYTVAATTTIGPIVAFMRTVQG